MWRGHWHLISQASQGLGNGCSHSRSLFDDEDDKLDVELIDLLDGNSRDEEEAKLAESIMVKHAYYFQISKLFITDLIFTKRQREISQEYFRRVSAMDALRVLSVELHFIYEVLHTKALAIRSKWSYVFRFIAFIDVAMAFVLFSCLKKRQLPELDVKITYLLLFGGIALDVIAVLMLVFSNWTIAKIQWYQTRSPKLDSCLHNLVSTTDYIMKPRIPTCEVESNTNATYKVLDTPLIIRRWSESISACNLLSESFEKSPKKMYKHDWCWGNIAFSNVCSFPFYMAENKTIPYFHRAVDTIARGFGMGNMDGKRSMIANTRYVSTNPFIMKLWIFIFKEVRRKFKYAAFWKGKLEIEKTREIQEARGDWFLETLQREAHHRSRGDSDTESVIYEARDDEDKGLQTIREHYVTLANYNESIITWHLATEMWYNIEVPTARNDEREFSKILSDYMMYLLLNQPNVVSVVAGIAQMRSATVLRWLRDHTAAEDVKSLCEAIFARNVEAFDPFREIPLVHRAIDLAHEIERLGEGKWRAMSGVWVEMLTYAASHIKGEAHAQVLSRGGELLAFVWLLMIHLGIVYRPEWGPIHIFRV